MIASPDSSTPSSPCTVSSVIFPAGTITQTERGALSFAARSASEAAPVAPSPSSPLTASGLTS